MKNTASARRYTSIEEYLAEVRARKDMTHNRRPYTPAQISSRRRQLEQAERRLSALVNEAQEALKEARRLIAENKFS